MVPNSDHEFKGYVIGEQSNEPFCNPKCACETLIFKVLRNARSFLSKYLVEYSKIGMKTNHAISVKVVSLKIFHYVAKSF